MSHKSKRCPKCGNYGIDTRHTAEHAALHYSAHGLRHHPLLAVFGLAATGVSKLLPRWYHCSKCKQDFKG